MIYLIRYFWRFKAVKIIALIFFFGGDIGQSARAQDKGMQMLSEQRSNEFDSNRLLLNLGDNVKASFFAKTNSLTSPLAKAEAIEAPGRGELAKVFVPDDRDKFEVTVALFKPGFAAEAPSISEQLLMENGYGITDANHISLTSADAEGKTLDEGKVAKLARSLCQVRQEKVMCFFMQGDAEHSSLFEEQARMLKDSLQIEDGVKEGFDANQIKHLKISLGAKGSLTLDYPSVFSVVDNDFSGDLPGTLHLQQGDADNPLSAIMVAASAGAAPPSAEAIDSVADGMMHNWLAQNAKLFTNPVLATKGDLSGLGSGDMGRSYAYVVDKLADGGGQAQVRLSLFASAGVRYSVLMVTHYAPGVDETGPFFVRLGGITGYDLVMQSILKRVH
ncbi:hypothetical protein ACQZ61_07210 [Agrobacterium vitis]|uniref:hypothetical protein n=1 Tax=Agrobacterium vitis TaxID=373 RepID=UPI0015DAEF1D|nr:hypothetical protein [Agrobacterium vitis]MCF1454231.1 hypothetical protein [Agrobacterium vitis]